MQQYHFDVFERAADDAEKVFTIDFEMRLLRNKQYYDFSNLNRKTVLIVTDQTDNYSTTDVCGADFEWFLSPNVVYNDTENVNYGI